MHYLNHIYEGNRILPQWINFKITKQNLIISGTPFDQFNTGSSVLQIKKINLNLPFLNKKLMTFPHKKNYKHLKIQFRKFLMIQFQLNLIITQIRKTYKYTKL